MSDPLAPVLLGGAVLDNVENIALQGMRACLAVWGEGIVVYDVSNPAAPYLWTWGDTPGPAHGVAASAVHLFVADVPWVADMFGGPVTAAPSSAYILRLDDRARVESRRIVLVWSAARRRP